MDYIINLTGATPLLMHADNIEWSDAMEQWIVGNKRAKARGEQSDDSKNGDDRTPAHKWIGCLWNDGERVVIPQEALRRVLVDAGARVKVGKGSLKKSVAGLLTIDSMCEPLLVRGREIKLAPIMELQSETSFGAHKSGVKAMGFDLLVKRARINMSKHVRVRPIFSDWSVSFRVGCFDPTLLPLETVHDLVVSAGRLIGLGDWRPGAPMSPGPYGRFEGSVKEAR